MTALQFIYKCQNPKAKSFPYWTTYSLWRCVCKLVRKWVNVVVAPNCPINLMRIWLYRLCGFKIGRNVFIGMRCYLDDLCYDYLVIEDDVTISYGVYFACHGRKQGHNKITLKKGAYIGMRANVISREGGVIIGAGAIVGAGALVNRSIPDGCTAVGVPARVVRHEA